ncbi:MAG: hypothetical protein K2Y17_12135 [Qipengyuania sp.]|nr:hypothetical protein [Qipengyuania sp.]
MKPHPHKAKMDALFPAIREYEALAKAHGISDIFQDNGGKLLQLILTLGLTVVPGRQGADAQDASGREYELKSVNIERTSSFSTNHHLNPGILADYRSVGWIFAIYRGIELSTIYRMEPEQLEPLFARWEAQWHGSGGRDINNPKIPLSFVADNGELIHGIRPQIGLRARSVVPPTTDLDDPFKADE